MCSDVLKQSFMLTHKKNQGQRLFLSLGLSLVIFPIPTDEGAMQKQSTGGIL